VYSQGYLADKKELRDTCDVM